MSDAPIVNVPGVLRRRLGLILLVLYGTGITIGAGIYVLVGAVAGFAGPYTPWSFLLAAAVMTLTVASYTELSTRFPASAGEAVYVKAAFQIRWLSTVTGLITVGIGIASSSTVVVGAVGYIQQFVDLPAASVIIVVVIVLGAVAAWGILESVLLASLFTLIEVGGLLAIIVAAVHARLPILAALTPPPLEGSVLSGIAFASLLAFFAFVGFEDLANVVEEARTPHRDIPRAMVLTLVISTILYVLVAAIAVAAVPIEALKSSPAPLGLVFREVAGVSPSTINVIAIVATMNTLLAQMTMASRVIYGMARQGDLPGIAGRVHPRTKTPLVATALVIVAVVGLALVGTIQGLAEITSLATLAVFALVNLALLRVHHRRLRSQGPHVRIPSWVPVAGFLTCLGMIASALLR